MKSVRLASEPAPGTDNEDNAFSRGDLVGVLDGASAPAGVDTGCVHGPAWYVQRLAAHLQAEAVPGVSLVDALAGAISAVREDHGGRCDLGHPNTPAATVALLRAHRDRVEYLVLCDAYVILDDGHRVELLTDERFAAAVADIRAAALTGASVIGSTDHDAGVRWAATERQQRTNRPGGYWIAAATPEAAYEAVTGVRPVSGSDRVRRAALLTDGAAAAVEQHRLFDWRGLLDLVADHGPDELIRRVRAAENADGAGQARPRYKRHDDASLVYCEFGGVSDE